MVRLLVIVIGLGLSAARSHAVEHTKDTPEMVKKAVADKKAVLLDVREKSEWDQGHLQGALFVPLSKLRKKDVDLKDLLKDLPKDKPIYAHCQAGIRCLTAAEILIKEGYDVRPLKPGYRNLLEAGFDKAK